MSLIHAAKKWIPLSVRRTVLRPLSREVGGLFIDLGLSLLGERDDLIPPRRLMQIGRGNYKAIGYEFLRYFVEFGRLQPQERVLDIGCGIGRMAYPLLHYLQDGLYEGIDIAPKGIRWCQTHITPRFPHFHFQTADIYNKAFNPAGKYKASEYTFPFQNESFDFIFLTSVFTHMLPKDVEHYIQEITRLLDTNGRVFSTWFLVNNESRQLMQEHERIPQILHPYEGEGAQCYIEHESVPEETVGFEEYYVKELFKNAGLSFQAPVRYGSWCARSNFTTFQDIIVAEKVKET